MVGPPLLFDLNAIALHESWRNHLQPEFALPYMQQLQLFLCEEIAADKVIYPDAIDVFNAFNCAPLSHVSVVILGQDPYHGEQQAHGLSFSVRHGIRVPPSLSNILKEIQRDFGCLPSNHGCLQAWAGQGVLLLNTTLTVERARAGSHQGQGWEQFTDHVIEVISEHCKHVVFLLWGSHSQKKCQLIDTDKHLVLKAPHPSPLSAYRGFIGCGHFSQANDYLQQHGKLPINWCLS